MARKVRCKICKEYGTDETFHKVTINGKNSYYCSEEEYTSFTYNNNKYHEVMLYIATDILEYEKGQILPANLKRRIKKLNEFYDYDVIKLCLEVMRNELNYYIKTKEFNNESHLVNYIMVVIENNINDAYKLWNHKRQMEIKSSKIESNVDLNILNKDTLPLKSNNDNGILEFLSEEDL